MNKTKDLLNLVLAVLAFIALTTLIVMCVWFKFND